MLVVLAPSKGGPKKKEKAEQVPVAKAPQRTTPGTPS
jgi:hypothetical protein